MLSIPCRSTAAGLMLRWTSAMSKTGFAPTDDRSGWWWATFPFASVTCLAYRSRRSRCYVTRWNGRCRCCVSVSSETRGTATRHSRRSTLIRIETFGLQEEFEEFCQELAARFGWDLGEPAMFANRTAAAGASDVLRERITHDNAFDVQLYRFARDL
jgi:hypothetical protein